MKTLKLALVLFAVPLAAAAQDAVKVDAAHYKVLIDNPSVRVLKVAYSPGAKSPMHSHPDSMIVSLQDSKARFTLPDGTTQDMDARQGDGCLHARHHPRAGQRRHDSRRRDPRRVQGEGARHGERAHLAPGDAGQRARGEPARDRVQDDTRRRTFTRTPEPRTTTTRS